MREGRRHVEVGGIGRPTNTGDDDSVCGGRRRAEASRTSGGDGGADKVVAGGDRARGDRQEEAAGRPW